MASGDNNLRLSKAGRDALSENRRLRAVLAAIPDLALETDLEGRFVTWHSDAARLPSDLRGARKGAPLAAFMPAEAASTCMKAIRDLAGGTTGPGGAALSLGQGARRRWFEISASVIDDGGYLLLLHEVTASYRQNAEIQLLSEVARRTTNIVLVTDPQRRVEWVNQAFCDITGWSLDEIRGKTPESFLRTQEIDPETSDMITRTVSEGRQVQTEVLNYTRDGRPFWSFLDIQPLFDPGGEMRGLVAVANDVTELRQQARAMRLAAEEAANARAALESAVGALQDGFVLFDADDRLVVCNARYRALFARSAEMMRPGVTFEDMLRHCVAAGEYPEAVGCEEDWIARRLARHHQPYSEYEQHYPDGRWLRVCERAVSDGGHVGLYVDITALKQAEIRALTDLAATMEASQDGIAFTDPDGLFRYMNRSHMAMFGFHSEDEAIGQHWSSLYDRPTAEWMQAHASPEMRRRGHWSGEVIGTARDGSPVDQDLSLTMKEDGGVLCISRDMRNRRREEAERLRLREELHMARRREIISQMAAGLAHDFSNLLTTISGNAALIEDGAAPGSLTRTSAGRILAASDQAVTLIRRLLTLGAHPSEPVLLDLAQPVRQASDLLRISLRAPAQIRLDLPDAPLEALADPTDILQLVLNLAINAGDAMAGQTGQISIALRPAGPDDLTGPLALGHADPARRWHCLEVSDEGSGMPPQIAARIFEPYFTTKGAGGSGLGMSVVSSVVRLNKAALKLDTHPGTGTRIRILWPAGGDGQQQPPLPQQDHGQAAPPDLNGAMVLLVDDQPDVLQALTRILEAAGAEVAAAENPCDILAAVSEDPGCWDILITDYDMPDMKGPDLARRVRAIAPKMKIMLISSLIESPDLPVPGFDAVMAKPIERSRFVTSVKSLLHHDKNT